MTRSPAPLLAAILPMVGLGASTLLLVDYLRPTPLFCAEGGGCDVVRQSVYAHLFGVPTPAFGVAFFAVALTLALSDGRARRLLGLLSWAGLAGGCAFLSLQLFVLHAVCKFCVIADVAGLGLFFVELAASGKAIAGRGLRVGIAVAAIAVAAAPIVVDRVVGPPAVLAVASSEVPEPILREQRPGVATIVEFVDFECPYCRLLHQTMEHVLAGYGAKVRLVRKQHPLQMHPHARTAARAACCAADLGAGDAMASALYSAPPDQLTVDGCEALAIKVGVDAQKFHACLDSNLPTQQLAADARDAQRAGVEEEAPVFWIGTVRFDGALPEPVIKAGIDEALANAL